jgi:hypothetical protein
MAQIECVATQGFLTFISMPLLTELVSIKAGFSYKHGAANGAVTTRQPSGVSGGDLPRDGSWGPAGGYSVNWHNPSSEILAPSFGP